ncbi:hypothetical protein P691DRAFT_830213 [Macrolepiota fuliginosa MF-IS2]|uniref:Uncharacterized protein n=1 Tax=Macrolepiota fuliginosa MF-IS2 TaxID=1400762 RepID=A0A9P5X832_9AGAR|nr:hypothetical protein P691DRAFT_830213 [Macrolepiota fuliginosa MF-IS2]
MDTTDDSGECQNSQLATLLSDTFKDVENLKRELATAKKRAEKAERLVVNLQTNQQVAADVSSSSGQSPDIARMIMEYEDRISRAERTRDEAESRRRAIQENWMALERYFSQIEFRAHDVRSQFGRVVSGDTSPLSLTALPSYGPSPRTPSMDSSFAQPPVKRSRDDSEARGRHPTYPPSYDDYHRVRKEPRMIRPGGHRSRSRSSEKSISSVDEMLLQATAQESNGTNGTQSRRPHNSTIHPANAYPSVGHQQQQQRSHPDSPPYPANRPRVDHPGPLPPSGGGANQAQPYLFAPVVTGAPPKKQKYTGGGGVTPAASATNLGPIETPPVPTPPVAAFPPTNAEGQRICRQCGLPGRYKDGKCVEKWGPGPMGPGTVCDRCRKKMKRVERRGTLEQQLANANANTLARTGSHVVVPQQQQQQQQQAQQQAQSHHGERSLQRSDTLLTHQGAAQGSNNGSQMSFRTVMSSASPGKGLGGRAMSPPPAIASLKDDDEHVGRSSSRSSSRNGRPGSKQLGHPPGPAQQTHLTVPAKRSPLASGSVSGDGKAPSPSGRGGEVDAETDADAEAEVDADAEGDGDNEEYEIDDDDEPPPRRSNKGRDVIRAVREADEELLEAVDAAEANSSSSHVGGRRYHDDD